MKVLDYPPRKIIKEEDCILTQPKKPNIISPGDPRIFLNIPDMYHNLVLSMDFSPIEIAKEIKEFIYSQHKNSISIKALEDSSHDFDQTIHRTIDLENLNSFWSSGGSDTADSSEFLLYEVYESP